MRISSGQRIEELLADPANKTLWEALAPLGGGMRIKGGSRIRISLKGKPETGMLARSFDSIKSDFAEFVEHTADL